MSVKRSVYRKNELNRKLKKKVKSFSHGGDEYRTLHGKIVKIYPDSRYLIELEEDERTITGYISGRMRINFIKIIPGDRVLVQLSIYNQSICRVVRRV
jgi:translation initiation factor IF-1